MTAALELQVKHGSGVQRFATRGTALAPKCSCEAQCPQDDQQQHCQDTNRSPKQPGALPTSLRQAQAVGPSMDSGFQISSIFSNKFMGVEGESSLVIGKDLWDNLCTCGKSCHMQYLSKCPRAAAHRLDSTPPPSAP